MQAVDVYAVLRQIGATQLHHANTVTTRCTFLEQGGLASRGFVEDRHLSQTAQPASDEIDKKYGIWHDVFLDHVDIHYRAGRVKGPNHYGPVLFILDLDILRRLPTGSDIRVTKSNPVHWFNGQPEGDRWFQSPEELAGNLVFGNFDKMLVIRTPSTMIPFPDMMAQLALDDPRKKRLVRGGRIHQRVQETHKSSSGWQRQIGHRPAWVPKRLRVRREVCSVFASGHGPLVHLGLHVLEDPTTVNRPASSLFTPESCSPRVREDR
jgi:hypothetical protein